MANIIPFENITVPAYLQNRTSTNDAFLAGLPQGGGFPMIGLKGTRFVMRADGAETAVPTLEIPVILISAKPNLDKTYYASKFDPNQTEPKSPDCFSKDGIKPDASATLKQCDSCAGCPMNQFGSGTDNQGNPGKGKACADTKMLAVFFNSQVFGFKVPPASLKAFGHYVKETSRRGVDLSTAITVIGFDTNFSFPVLTFNFGGFLAEQQVNMIQQMKGSPEVADIIGGGTQTLVSPAVAAKPAAPVAPVALDPFAQVITPAEPTKVKPIRAPKEKPVEVAPVEDDDLAALAAELGVTI
jgi:hypothetical protein